MDTDRDGHIDIDEWETCIEDALKNKLAARAAKRELDAKNPAKEIEEFTNEFLSAALLRINRQGRRRHPVDGRDRRGREERCGSDRLPQKLRRGEPAVPPPPAAPQEGAGRPRRGQVR